MMVLPLIMICLSLRGKIDILFILLAVQLIVDDRPLLFVMDDGPLFVMDDGKTPNAVSSTGNGNNISLYDY